MRSGHVIRCLALADELRRRGADTRFIARHLPRSIKSTVSDRRRRMLVAEVNGRPAGSVRLDQVDGGTEVSWAIAPEMRGRRLGRRMVALALERVAGYVLASLHKGNAASVRIAQAVGMRFKTRAQDWVRYSLVKDSRHAPEEPQQ